MAIYHFSGHMISRAKGQSATAAAAYRSGQSIYSERYNKTNEYKRMTQPKSFLLTPEHAPDWTQDREHLWNEVEKVEKQKNAQLAREFNVALPIEISDQEQNQLAQDFCQDVFVDEGMVADISIHRDDINNPHFHVMLTTRGFKLNGEWDAKASKVKLDNGKEKRISRTNWDDRETFRKWRELWSEYANQSLEINGVPDRISHLSHELLNRKELPTIHEGYKARKMGDQSERVSVNKQIKTHNQKLQDLNEFKQEKQKMKNTEDISRSFSPKEKKEIARAAKDLKMFVTFRSVNEKQKMLQRWEFSTLTKSIESKDRDQKINQIQSVKSKVQIVDAILNKEAHRFIKKHYPHIHPTAYSDFSKKYLVEWSINENTIFSPDESETLLEEGDQEEINHELSKLVRDRHYSYGALTERSQSLGETFSSFIQDHQVDFSKPETFERLDPSIQKKIRSVHQMKESTDQAIQFLEDHYNQKLERMYGIDMGSDLSTSEKELVVGYNEYFRQPFPLDTENLEGTPFKFSTKEKSEMIGLLHRYQHGEKDASLDAETRFAQILSGNASIQHYFIAECMETGDFDADTQAKLEDIIQAYEDDHEGYVTFNDSRHIGSLSRMVTAVEHTVQRSLSQADRDEQEKHREMIRLQHKNRHRGMSR